MRRKSKDFSLIFWIHTILEIFECFAFLLIDWQIILIILILLQIQYSVLSGCVLANIEFGEYNYTFNWYYLVKVFPNLDPKFTTLIFRYIIPFLVLALAVYLQVFVGYTPVLNLIK